MRVLQSSIKSSECMKVLLSPKKSSTTTQKTSVKCRAKKQVLARQLLDRNSNLTQFSKNHIPATEREKILFQPTISQIRAPHIKLKICQTERSILLSKVQILCVIEIKWWMVTIWSLLKIVTINGEKPYLLYHRICNHLIFDQFNKIQLKLSACSKILFYIILSLYDEFFVIGLLA